MVNVYFAIKVAFYLIVAFIILQLIISGVVIFLMHKFRK